MKKSLLKKGDLGGLLTLIDRGRLLKIFSIIRYSNQLVSFFLSMIVNLNHDKV